MASHAPPSRTRESKATGPIRARPAQAQRPRCLGPAAQLAAIHRTLRGGVIQRHTAPGETAQARRPERTGLPHRLRSGVEALSGLAMDDVRVHRNSPEPARLGALAYTKGSDIHLGPGQEHHLPHEAWHVVQQKQARVKATTQTKRFGINKDPRLEAEADRMAGRIEAASATAAAPVRRRNAPVEAPLQKKDTPASEAVFQLQDGSGGLSKPVIKWTPTTQDNARANLIDKKVAEAKAKQVQAELEARQNMTPEQKKFEEYGKANPELYAWVQAEMKKKKPVTTISQGKKLTPYEQEYSDLWRLEYDTRDKYCTEWEKEYLEATGGFKNPYVKDRLYVLQNSGAGLWLNPESPVSVWKFLEMFSRLLGRGPSVPGQVKTGMKSQLDRMPFTPHSTIVDPRAGLPPGSPMKLNPGDL